jgi:uncharacterized membrane protein
MYPYMYGAWFLGMLLMVVVPLFVLGVLTVIALIVASPNRPSEDKAMRIVTRRAARGEIEREQLGVLLNAL